MIGASIRRVTYLLRPIGSQCPAPGTLTRNFHLYRLHRPSRDPLLNYRQILLFSYNFPIFLQIHYYPKYSFQTCTIKMCFWNGKQVQMTNPSESFFPRGGRSVGSGSRGRVAPLPPGPRGRLQHKALDSPFIKSFMT